MNRDPPLSGMKEILDILGLHAPAAFGNRRRYLTALASFPAQKPAGVLISILLIKDQIRILITVFIISPVPEDPEINHLRKDLVKLWIRFPLANISETNSITFSSA